MVSLEQVRALEARVEKAVALIAALRAENTAFKQGLSIAEARTAAAEARTTELEGLITEFQKDQERIEAGILQALRKLDAFEDVVHAATQPLGTVAAKVAVVVPGSESAEPEASPTLSGDPETDDVLLDDDVLAETVAGSDDSTIAWPEDPELAKSFRQAGPDDASADPEHSNHADGQDASDGLDIF
jgi:chromosome segregation ATPase